MTQTVNIKTNQKEILKKLGRKAKRHIPEATKWGINNTSKKLQKAYQVQSNKYLDSPTRFTTNAFAIGFATAKKLSGFVVVKDIQAKYLRWAFEGGTSTPSKKIAVPTENRKLNKFGNIPGKRQGVVKGKQVIRQTKRGAGVWSAPTKKTPAKLLIAFKTSINYRKTFPFYKIGKKIVDNVLPKELEKSFKKEMSRR